MEPNSVGILPLKGTSIAQLIELGRTLEKVLTILRASVRLQSLSESFLWVCSCRKDREKIDFSVLPLPSVKFPLTWMTGIALRRLGFEDTTGDIQSAKVSKIFDFRGNFTLSNGPNKRAVGVRSAVMTVTYITLMIPLLSHIIPPNEHSST